MSDATDLLDKAKDARERMTAAKAELEELHTAMVGEVCHCASLRPSMFFESMRGAFELANTQQLPTVGEMVAAAFIVVRVVVSLYPPRGGETATEWARRANQHVGDLLRAELNGQRR